MISAISVAEMFRHQQKIDDNVKSWVNFILVEGINIELRGKKITLKSILT